MEPSSRPSLDKQRLFLSIDLRIVIVGLLLVIAAMLWFWQPWQNYGAGDRTITVVGDTTLAAEPDEYVFSPVYEFSSADQQAALAELTKKSDEIINRLKGLGVADNQIKSSARAYGGINYQLSPIRIDDGRNVYSLSLTITVGGRQLAQKVQDYLLTTSPKGEISPQVSFSDKKRHELENKARDQASKDARSKAEQTAKNLGFKITKIKSVTEGHGFGIEPLPPGVQAPAEGNLSGKKLPIQPGENKLQYSVTVVYYIR